MDAFACYASGCAFIARSMSHTQARTAATIHAPKGGVHTPKAVKSACTRKTAYATNIAAPPACDRVHRLAMKTTKSSRIISISTKTDQPMPVTSTETNDLRYTAQYRAHGMGSPTEESKMLLPRLLLTACGTCCFRAYVGK